LTGLLSLWSVEPPAVFARLSVGQLWDSPLVRLRDTKCLLQVETRLAYR